jgi:hypothetical protein
VDRFCCLKHPLLLLENVFQRMHASFTQTLSSHVMGRVPLVRFSRSFTTRINPSQGHLSPFRLARALSFRMTSRIPINSPLPTIPVRHLWNWKQSRSRIPSQVIADEREEAIKANLLELAYKGRQPGDMMLRCNVSPYVSHQPWKLIANFDNRHHS